MWTVRSSCFTLLIFLMSATGKVSAQPFNTSGYDTLSLEELMNLKITVASVKELTPRQSPGIITYITAEDIRNSGARDLMDVLQQVPGFEFGMDVEGVVGLAVRGNWAHEGKVALYIDGIEMNENLYSTLQFGNHYPIDQISRIEIIRGPGSALYGGNAAFAVVNVITRKPEQDKQLSVSSSVSASAKSVAATNVSLFAGRKGERSSYSVNVNGKIGDRSHAGYQDIYKNGFAMLDNSRMENLFINSMFETDRFHARYIVDYFHLDSRDGFVEISDTLNHLEFHSHHFDARYDLVQTEKFKLTPRFRFSHMVPWSTEKDDLETTTDPFRIESNSWLTGLDASYAFGRKVTLNSGATWQFEDAQKRVHGEVFRSTGMQQFTNENIAAFTQLLIESRIANITAGLRFNYNRRFDPALVHRLALTREVGRFHFKALLSRAFRAPGVQNIDLATDIKPEFTDVFELEAGARITDDIYITLNAYRLETRDPIFYFVDPATNFDAYTNLTRTGTSGLEMVFQLRKKWGQIDINGSYYETNDDESLEAYLIPGKRNVHLGLAPFKGNSNFRFNVSRYLQVGFNYNYLSSRYGINALDATGNPVYSVFSDQHLLGCYADLRFRYINGLSLRLAGHNMLDQKIWFIQPYNSLHAPLPGMSRTIELKVIYQNF